MSTRRRANARQAMTLIEIVVVIAVLGLIALVSMPALNAIFDLQQRASAREIAQTYTWLVDEAALRNATFRVAFDLDRGTWKVEVGDPNTVVFASPEEREAADEEMRAAMSRYTKRELEEGGGPEADEQSRFEGLTDPSFTTGEALPDGVRFDFVWTPQYGEDGLRPNPDFTGDEEDPENGPNIAYSYVFSDGTAEHTLIRIVDIDDESEGYTIEIEPTSGRVQLHTELIAPGESLAWLPDEGPGLQ